MRYLLDPFNYDLTDSGSIPNLLMQHLTIVWTSMLISILIALPLGVLIARYRRLSPPVITLAGLLYSVPALALLAFLVPITGVGNTANLTIEIPLVLYAQLVLVRNTVAAIDAVDPLLLEVGRAMGLNRWQALIRVTAPLALPIIVAGIRVATVTTIGIASLASEVGAGGLGRLIFGSIENQNFDEVTAGVILFAALALSADLLLLALQKVLGNINRIIYVGKVLIEFVQAMIERVLGGPTSRLSKLKGTHT